jgi:hypothetical protein
LSRQLNNIIGEICFVLYFAVMIITPLVIVVLGIVNITRDKMQQGVNILQAAAALVIWIILSVATFSAFIITTFSYPVYKTGSNEIINNVVFIAGGVIYFLVSAVLIFWTKRQTRRMPGMGISC